MAAAAKFVVVSTEELFSFVVRCIEKAGGKVSHAEALAELLVAADKRGHFSHGLNRLDMYVRDLESKITSGTAEPEIVNETPATALVEGNNILGPVVGKFCIDLAIKKAKEVGVGWVCASGSNHFGIAGWYSMRASNQGLLGMAFTNTSPLLVPTRAKKAALGTNPISVAAPAQKDDSFVLDMATTTVALGKVEINQRKDLSIPEGWGVDSNGKVTKNPADVLNNGGLLPLGGVEETGGYKGYGLALMTEIFCGVLAGANSGANIRNTIRINFIISIFLSELFFLIGVARTKPEILCRIVAIFLHYFFISTFAWLFVEILHIYRMLTEIRDINTGSMKFYYLVGFVIPGIIVGLAVGLYTDQYGTAEFCWLSTKNMFIWSFAGPIVVVWIISVLTCILGWQASCREKVHVSHEDLGMLKESLLVASLLLPMCGANWVFALLSVNQNYAAFHYLFAIMSCFMGVFIFVFYVVCSRPVRFEIKRVWYKFKGKKLELDEALGGTRSTMLSRSALAYRNDSSMDGGLNRMNIGISTTSTTSRSTSKTSSGGLYKGDDYMRSTNSSTTSGHAPSMSMHPPNTGIPPYDSYHLPPPPPPSLPLHDNHHPDDPDTGEKTTNLKPDSDSDSDDSDEHASLELASSHSSDDEDLEDEPKWEMPKNKKVEEAREQARKMNKKEKEKSPGSFKGSRDYISNEYRTTGPMVTFKDTPSTEPSTFRDRLQNPPRSILSSPRKPSNLTSPDELQFKDRSKIQIIAHNGNLSSDSECSNSTTV